MCVSLVEWHAIRHLSFLFYFYEEFKFPSCFSMAFTQMLLLLPEVVINGHYLGFFLVQFNSLKLFLMARISYIIVMYPSNLLHFLVILE